MNNETALRYCPCVPPPLPPFCVMFSQSVLHFFASFHFAPSHGRITFPTSLCCSLQKVFPDSLLIQRSTVKRERGHSIIWHMPTAYSFTSVWIPALLLCLDFPFTLGHAVMHVANLSTSLSNGLLVGTVQIASEVTSPRISVGDRCWIDARLPRTFYFESYVCNQTRATVDSQRLDVSVILPNISVIRSRAVNGTAFNGSYLAQLLPDRDDSQNPIVLLLTMEYSKYNRLDPAMCIAQVQQPLVTAASLLVNALAHNNDFSLLFFCRGVEFPRCAFGVGVGITTTGGVGLGTDKLLYDIRDSSFWRATNVAELPAYISTQWNLRVSSSAFNPSFLGNQTETPSLASFGIRLSTTSASLTFQLEQPSATLLALWPAILSSCNVEISRLRTISNGEQRSEGVMLYFDGMLRAIYAILPIEIAKAYTVRSRFIDELSCTSFCDGEEDVTLLQQATGDGQFAPPCWYECSVLEQLQPNATVSVDTSVSILNSMLPPLMVQPMSTSSLAFQLNMSYYIRLKAIPGANLPRLTIVFSTWGTSDTNSVPVILLGQLFTYPCPPVASVCDLSRNINSAFVSFTIDRTNTHVGVSPRTASALLTDKDLHLMCVPAPECGDDVFVAEINKCVSSTCSTFYIMGVDPANGVCYLRRDVIVAAVALFLFVVVGETVLMIHDSWMQRQLDALAGEKAAGAA